MEPEHVELLSPGFDDSKTNAEQYEALDVSKRIIEFEETTDYEAKFKQTPSLQKGCCPTTLWDKIITATYIISILVAIAMTIFYFATDEDIEQILSLLIVCVTTWVGVIVAMIAIKQGFNVRDQADKLIAQNERYRNELIELSKQREILLTELKQTRNNARKLTSEEKKLSDSVDKFGDLVGEFEKMKDEFGKQFESMFTEMEESNNILQGIQDQNHRAKLYAKFFDASGDDQQEGLSRDEYDDFIYEIPEKYSKKFKELKLGFDEIDINHNGNISKYEFEQAVQQVIDAMHQDNGQNVGP